MAAVSKFFNENIRYRQCCNDLVHTNDCYTNALRNIYRILLTNTKHFMPITLIPLLLKIRNIDRTVIKDALKLHMEATLTGTAVGWLAVSFLCTFRRIFGEFKMFGFVFVPAHLAALATFLSTPRIKNIFITSTLQAALETYLLQRRNSVTKAIMGSPAIQTVGFMCASALILHAKRNHNFKGFWLLRLDGKVRRPMITENDENAKPCPHPDCNVYLLRGVCSYLSIGLAMETIKVLLTKVTTDASADGGSMILPTLLAKFRKIRLRSTLFLAAYVGIYRLTFCQLNRRVQMDEAYRHLLAAFLAGSCYRFQPNTSLLSYGIILSTYVLWRKFKGHDWPAKWKFLEFIKDVPFAVFTYPFSVAYLMHTFLVTRRPISGMGKLIINEVGGHVPEHIFNNLNA